MKFKRKTNVTVNLKDLTWLHIFCTQIFIKKRFNELVPDYYAFMLYDEVVAEIPCGMVKDFHYFKSTFDIEPTYFSFISQGDANEETI